jgi:hypothetical protein
MATPRPRSGAGPQIAVAGAGAPHPTGSGWNPGSRLRALAPRTPPSGGPPPALPTPSPARGAAPGPPCAALLCHLALPPCPGRGRGAALPAARQLPGEGMRNAECGMQSAECRVRNAECRVRNAECRVRNAECRVRNAECGAEHAVIASELTAHWRPVRHDDGLGGTVAAPMGGSRGQRPPRGESRGARARPFGPGCGAAAPARNLRARLKLTGARGGSARSESAGTPETNRGAGRQRPLGICGHA